MNDKTNTQRFDHLLNEIRAEHEEALTKLHQLASIGNIRPSDDIPQILAEQRDKQSLSMRSLSDLSEVSLGTLSKIENGQFDGVQLDTLKKIFGALGLKIWIG